MNLSKHNRVEGGTMLSSVQCAVSASLLISAFKCSVCTLVVTVLYYSLCCFPIPTLCFILLNILSSAHCALCVSLASYTRLKHPLPASAARPITRFDISPSGIGFDLNTRLLWPGLVKSTCRVHMRSEWLKAIVGLWSFSCMTLWIGFDSTQCACAHDMLNQLIGGTQAPSSGDWSLNLSVTLHTHRLWHTRGHLFFYYISALLRFNYTGFLIVDSTG